METLTAEDDKGRSFTQILSSVCKENGGAVDILEIEKFVFTLDFFLDNLNFFRKVNEQMKEKRMDQRCKADGVLGWELGRLHVAPPD